LEFNPPITFGGLVPSWVRGLEFNPPITFEGVINPPKRGDAIPPSVGSFDPAPGSTISRFQDLAFTVEESGFDPDLPYAFALIAVFVYYPGSGAYEVAHDGEAFAPGYASSTVQILSPGSTRITLRRVGGWPASPTVRVRAVDKSGNLDV
jgi:hypothetical protein